MHRGFAAALVLVTLSSFTISLYRGPCERRDAPIVWHEVQVPLSAQLFCVEVFMPYLLLLGFAVAACCCCAVALWALVSLTRGIVHRVRRTSKL